MGLQRPSAVLTKQRGDPIQELFYIQNATLGTDRHRHDKTQTARLMKKLVRARRTATATEAAAAGRTAGPQRGAN